MSHSEYCFSLPVQMSWYSLKMWEMEHSNASYYVLQKSYWGTLWIGYNPMWWINQNHKKRRKDYVYKHKEWEKKWIWNWMQSFRRSIFEPEYCLLHIYFKKLILGAIAHTLSQWKSKSDFSHMMLYMGSCVG